MLQVKFINIFPTVHIFFNNKNIHKYIVFLFNNGNSLGWMDNVIWRLVMVIGGYMISVMMSDETNKKKWRKHYIWWR